MSIPETGPIINREQFKDDFQKEVQKFQGNLTPEMAKKIVNIFNESRSFDDFSRTLTQFQREGGMITSEGQGGITAQHVINLAQRIRDWSVPQTGSASSNNPMATQNSNKYYIGEEAFKKLGEKIDVHIDHYISDFQESRKKNDDKFEAIKNSLLNNKQVLKDFLFNGTLREDFADEHFDLHFEDFFEVQRLTGETPEDKHFLEYLNKEYPEEISSTRIRREEADFLAPDTGTRFANSEVFMLLEPALEGERFKALARDVLLYLINKRI